MLSSNQIAAMRDAIEELMPDTCNILTVTGASDGQGGMTQTWGTATANVKCRLDREKRAAFEAVAGDALQPFGSWVLSLPHGTEISAQDRVEVSSLTFNVISVDGGKSWSAVVRAVLEAI